ncbi:MAG: cellulose binding domain-containing protein [Bacillota bacterium]|nr:cellulose binding domain-containing protein [Bacillota bacterium]
MWSGSYTVSRGTVSAKNLSYNGTIAPGGTQSFGFNINYSGTLVKPSSFTLNATACQVQ